MSIDSMASGWTLTLLRHADARDGSGGLTRTYTPDAVWQGFPGGVQPLTAHEKWLAGLRRVNLTDKVYLAFDVAVVTGDLLTVAETGQKFVVEGYRNVGGQNRLWVVEVREQT